MKKLIKILIAFLKKLFTSKKQNMSKTPNPSREPKQYGEYLQKTGKQIWNKKK